MPSCRDAFGATGAYVSVNGARKPPGQVTWESYGTGDTLSLVKMGLNVATAPGTQVGAPFSVFTFFCNKRGQGSQGQGAQ